MTLRVFTALYPSDEAVEHLDEFLEPRRSAGELRWTLPDQFHITCAFIGSADERRIDEYVDMLAEALGRASVPVLQLAGPVAFPNAAAARVLATSVVASSEGGAVALDRIAGKARSSAVNVGLQTDGARFRPHVTIARTRPVDVSNWVRLLETYTGPEWPALELAVMASHLGDGPNRRPRHELLARVPVGGR